MIEVFFDISLQIRHLFTATNPLAQTNSCIQKAFLYAITNISNKYYVPNRIKMKKESIKKIKFNIYILKMLKKFLLPNLCCNLFFFFVLFALLYLLYNNKTLYWKKVFMAENTDVFFFFFHLLISLILFFLLSVYNPSFFFLFIKS